MPSADSSSIMGLGSSRDKNRHPFPHTLAEFLNHYHGLVYLPVPSNN